jgi:hypothetical protein
MLPAQTFFSKSRKMLQIRSRRGAGGSACGIIPRSAQIGTEEIMTDRHENPDDKYARESFTFRAMKRWQIWSLAAAAIAILAVMLIYNGA